MRPVHAELATYLDTNSIGTIRHLVALATKAGVVARWTDHEADIVYGGATYYRGGEGTTYPIPKVSGGTQKAGLEIGAYSLVLKCGSGALFAGTYIPAAAAAHVFDGATVAIVRYFPEAAVTSPDDRAMPLWTGYVGDVSVSSASVELEVESGVALLNVALPKRVFQSACTHILYDSGCGLVRASNTVTGTVSSGATTTTVPTSRTEATGTTNTAGWFALGVITFTSGACNGQSRAVRSYSGTGGTFVMDRPLPAAPANGDTFSVYPGCPRTYAACSNNTAAAGPQFNNAARFAGFDLIPKNEAAL